MADKKLVMWGDSMVRQMFNRLPALFRGQLRSLDLQGFSVIRYDACECASQYRGRPLLSSCQCAATSFFNFSAQCACAVHWL